MLDVETGRKARPGTMRAIYLQKKISCDRARQYSHSEARDADNRREQNAAEYDSDVVNQRRQRRYDELPFRILHRAQNAPLVETNLRRQHQAGKKNHARALRRTESGSNPSHDVRSENLANQ